MRISGDEAHEINQLYARFHLAVDLGDVEGYVASFIEDGWFEVTNLPDGAPASGRTTGHAALRTMATALTTGVAKNSRHFTSPTSTVMTRQGGEIHTTGYLFELRPGTVPNVGVFLTGLFEDVIVYDGDELLFASKTIRMDPQPDAGAPTDVLITRFDALHPRS